MESYAAIRVEVTDKDFTDAYEAKYGEKIATRIILWPKKEQSIAMQAYPKIRDSEEEFDRASKQQANAQLAAQAGAIPAFGKHTSGDEALEKAAFRLQPNEISPVIETQQGYVVIKCVKRIPPESDKRFEDVKESFREDIITRKINQQGDTQAIRRAS